MKHLRVYRPQAMLPATVAVAVVARPTSLSLDPSVSSLPCRHSATKLFNLFDASRACGRQSSVPTADELDSPSVLSQCLL